MNQLTTTLDEVLNLLSETSLNPQLPGILTTSFGKNYNPTEANNIFTLWRNQDFSNLPPIQILPATILHNAQGGYSASTNTIYLSSTLLEEKSPSVIRNVLLEEIGHFIDAHINPLDTPGDEGAIFSALVQGKTLTENQLSHLRAEDDSATIYINVKPIKIEQSIDLLGYWNPTSGSILNVEVMGDLAFVNNGVFGLVIVDVSNPATPSRLGSFDTSASTLVDVVGDLAFVVSGSGLVIVDVSNSSAPSLLGSFDTSGNARDVEVVGDLAFVADYHGGLVIVDVSNPVAPSQLAYWDTYGWALDVEVVGDLAFVAHFYDGLVILDVSDYITPVAPTLQFSQATYEVNENGSLVGSAITVTRTGNTDSTATVTLNLSDGTAIAPGDYDNTPITVNFAVGETEQTITISIVNDTSAEGDETVNLTLVNPSDGYSLGEQSIATLTIIDDDTIDFPPNPIEVFIDITFNNGYAFATNTIDPGQTRYYKFELPTLPGKAGKYQSYDQVFTENGVIKYAPFELTTVFNGGAEFTILNDQFQSLPDSGLNNQSLPSYLTPGVYYYEVSAPATLTEPITYGWTSAITGISGLVIGENNETKPVAIRSFNNETLNPVAINEDTWLISHGLNDNPNNSNFTDLAEEIRGENYQTLMMDWSIPANEGFVGRSAQRAARNIEDVATFAVDALTNIWGITPDNLNLIGHSLGTYISAEIAGTIAGNNNGGRENGQPLVGNNNKVERLIALDPAKSTDWNGSFIVSNNGTELYPYDFNTVANFSRAFYGKGKSGLGSPTRASTAHESFEMLFGNWVGAGVNNHSNIVKVYTDLISSNENNIERQFNLTDNQRITEIGDYNVIENSYGSNEGKLHIEDDARTAKQLDFKVQRNEGFFKTGEIKVFPNNAEAKFGLNKVPVVLDGYINDAILFGDINGNRTLDENEASVIINLTELLPLEFTESQVTDFINADSVPMLVLITLENTLDVSTALPFETWLTAPFESEVITPLTTLVAKLQKEGISLDDAQTQVKTVFAIDPSIDLLNYDPLRRASLEDSLAKQVFASGAGVQNVVTQIVKFLSSASGESLGRLSLFVFEAMAQNLANLSLNESDTIIQIINDSVELANITLNQEQNDILAQVATIIAEGSQRVSSVDIEEPQAFVQAVTRVQKVSQGEVASDLQQLAQNPRDINNIFTQNTGENLDNQIINAQIANLFAPIVEDVSFQIDNFDSVEVGHIVGTLTANDADGDSLTFRIVEDDQFFLDINGNGINAFAIDPNTGVITVQDSDDLNGELILTFDFQVEVSDGTFAELGNVRIGLVDDIPVDDTPIDDTPVDDTPVDDTPVDDTPVDDTPVDDTPVDDIPVDAPNSPFYRFQNADRPSTFLFTGEEERMEILQNFPNFIEEGFAFSVFTDPEDGLIRFSRFQNSNVPGTYVYASEQESMDIRQNSPNFVEEGTAFYAYPADADIGEDIFRFESILIPETFLYVGDAGRQDILANYSNYFVENGVVFEVPNVGDDLISPLFLQTPIDDTPIDDTPVDDTPIDDTPIDDTPVDDTGIV